MCKIKIMKLIFLKEYEIITETSAKNLAKLITVS